MAKFKFYVATGTGGSARSQAVEIDDEYLDGLSESEKVKVIDEYFNEWLWNHIDAGWTEE